MAQQMLTENNLDMDVINPDMEKLLQKLREGQQLDQNFCLGDNEDQVNANLKIKTSACEKRQQNDIALLKSKQ